MQRGFKQAEYEARVARAQRLMKDSGLDALLLTTEPEVRYFTGYLTRFWESPSRPWFLIVQLSGKPVAVIPSIGAALMGKTWIDDIRTWSAPDLKDDGVSLLSNALIDLVREGGSVGIPSGHETHLRMPLADFERVKASCAGLGFTSDNGITRRLRMIKSDAEIAKIQHACDVAGRAFARVPEIAGEGVPLDRVFATFSGFA